MNNIIFRCEFCDRTFKNKGCRNQHQSFCKNNPNKTVKSDKYYESLKTRKKTKPTYKKENFVCEFCKKEFFTVNFAFTRHRKCCEMNPNRIEDASSHKGSKVSDKTRLLWKKNGTIGGYRKGAGRGKKGYYKGLYCMSTWELAWVVYQLEHGQKVEQCKERFEYIMDEEVHHYTPDFVINGIYYEIKNWHRPDTDFKVSQFPKDKTLILIEGKEQNKMFLEYAKNKYGANFDEVLYEKC